MSSDTSISFFGASGGCGLATLRHSLEAGFTCVALCRTASKLTDQFPADKHSNLTVHQGNAHDSSAVSRCLLNPLNPSRLVDFIVFSIGGVFNFSHLTIDDPNVCKNGIAAVFEALSSLRAKGISGRPRLIIVSTNGISKVGRDFPLVLLPLYRLLHVPHADKKVMEQRLVDSGEDWTIIRPSLLVNGDSKTKTKKAKKIRVGIEDPVKGVLESKELGYTISREDVGAWVFQNILKREADNGKYLHKAVSITY